MKIFTTLILFLSVFSLINAQEIEATTTNFDDNTFSASQLTIDIPFDQVKDYWDEFWDDKYDIDIDRENRDRESETFLA
ncbi:MAG: hypothetical protein AAF741_15510 [Bacteroidota bacterium]